MLPTFPPTLSAVSADEDYWPGKSFGLPESGPRSVPGVARRLAALAIDWAIAVGVSFAFFDYSALSIAVVFIIAQALFGLVLGGSPGHLVMGMRMAPIRGGRLGVIAPLVRPFLVMLVIPPMINDRDHRGVHDRLVGTIMVSR
jgi:hypothetical protein